MVVVGDAVCLCGGTVCREAWGVSWRWGEVSEMWFVMCEKVKSPGHTAPRPTARPHHSPPPRIIFSSLPQATHPNHVPRPHSSHVPARSLGSRYNHDEKNCRPTTFHGRGRRTTHFPIDGSGIIRRASQNWRVGDSDLYYVCFVGCFVFDVNGAFTWYYHQDCEFVLLLGLWTKDEMYTNSLEQSCSGQIAKHEPVFVFKQKANLTSLCLVFIMIQWKITLILRV